MKVAIVTDSNSGITQDEAKELGVYVIPMPFLINDQEYFEDINLNQEEFYKMLLNNAEVSTSQPSIYSVCELWTEILKTHDEIVHIPMSSGLSASCETAIAASKEFNGKVQVVNNRRISITQKQSVFDAMKLVEEGKSAKEIKTWLEETSMQASIYIMVSTLKYLKKGGRITPAAAAIGTLLNIKPVLTIQGAKLDKFMQVMSINAAKKRMIDQIVKELDTRFSDLVKQNKIVIAMAYTHDRNRCLEFKKEADVALKKFGLEIEMVDPLSLSVSCHIGDGAIAIGTFIKR